VAVRDRAWLLLVLLAVACRPGAADKASLVGQGDEHMTAREYQGAVHAYSRAVALDPRGGTVRVKLARAYENLERWNDAARESVRAAELLRTTMRHNSALVGEDWLGHL
jgi:Flp pilus assembly protein TadD